MHARERLSQSLDDCEESSFALLVRRGSSVDGWPRSAALAGKRDERRRSYGPKPELTWNFQKPKSLVSTLNFFKSKNPFAFTVYAKTHSGKKKTTEKITELFKWRRLIDHSFEQAHGPKNLYRLSTANESRGLNPCARRCRARFLLTIFRLYFGFSFDFFTNRRICIERSEILRVSSWPKEYYTMSVRSSWNH